MYDNKNTDDIELLNQIKRNSTRALKILFEKYFSSLCFFSYQIVKSTDLAEEAVSDIFSNIWLRRKEIVVKTKLKNYLYQAVRNQSLNYLKQNKLLFENFDELNHVASQPDSNPQKVLDYNEFEKQIEEVLKELPEKRGLIFRMNRIDGLSYKEIADILSISINTVQNQMVKAVKYLSNQHPRLKKLFSLLIFIIQF